MELSSVDEFLASYNILEDSIKVIGISDPCTSQPDSLISLDDYLKRKGVDQKGIRITRTLWLFGWSKLRRKVRSSPSLAPAHTTDQNRVWMWIAIAMSQVLFATWLSLPAKAQCQDEVSQNWLQFSIELITESLQL
jgi:hypothetical protein